MLVFKSGRLASHCDVSGLTRNFDKHNTLNHKGLFISKVHSLTQTCIFKLKINLQFVWDLDKQLKPAFSTWVILRL